MARHTTFQYQLDPTIEQAAVLARHAGASRFAYNQCLALHLQARTRHDRDPAAVVPWSGFDLINMFNMWKKSAAAGQLIAVDTAGRAEIVVTGLRWRGQVCQQVFEEAAVDLGRALKAWSDSRRGKRAGRRIEYPRWKKKGRHVSSFRIRNKHPKGKASAIRIGDAHPRSVTLPGVGEVRVHDDTRPLRRLLAKQRGSILFATVSQRGGRWFVSLNVAAADLHSARRHSRQPEAETGDWIGVDRGLRTFVVAATAQGRETARVEVQQTPLMAALAHQRRLNRAVTRKRKGSRRRKYAAARLGRSHYRVACIRKHFMHQVANRLVKTHDHLVIEDLNVAGMLRNHRLARAISDAAWTEFARLLGYKQAWRGGQLAVADRWFASSKMCSSCGAIRTDLKLSQRTYVCDRCGISIDRDLNAAANLAAWAEQHHARVRDPQAGGPVIKAHRQEGSGRRSRVGETSLDDVGTFDQAPTA